MTKKQREEAIAFMYENEVELVYAPFGGIVESSCNLCYFNDLGECPKIGGALLCCQMAHEDLKTFFRKVL